MENHLLAHPAVQAIVSHQRDITERRAAQDRIAYAASHDSLTGLANGPISPTNATHAHRRPTIAIQV